MRVEDREKPLIAFFRSLLSYLEVHGLKIISLAELTGQEYIRIGFHGIYRHHNESTGYRYFIEIISSLSESDKDKLRSLGIEIYHDDKLGDYFIKLPLKNLKCFMVNKELILEGNLDVCLNKAS